MAAKKKTNGHDPMTARMVEVLERIEAELKTSREETNARLDALKTVTENAHRHIHERIDEAMDEAVANTQRLTDRPEGLVARIEWLEAVVFKRTG